jgi:hypothetical protein
VGVTWPREKTKKEERGARQNWLLRKENQSGKKFVSFGLCAFFLSCTFFLSHELNEIDKGEKKEKGQKKGYKG